MNIKKLIWIYPSEELKAILIYRDVIKKYINLLLKVEKKFLIEVIDDEKALSSHVYTMEIDKYNKLGYLDIVKILSNNSELLLEIRAERLRNLA